jgi:hypothetical protein
LYFFGFSPHKVDSNGFANQNRKHEHFLYKLALSVRERLGTGDGKPESENWKVFFFSSLTEYCISHLPGISDQGINETQHLPCLPFA